jgi:phosphosulfolactate synthase (CoM biosynthesis protein A)
MNFKFKKAELGVFATKVSDMNFNKNITKCNIEGTILEYQYCADSVNEYPLVKDKVYLGFGRIHSVNGVIQIGEIKKHFWTSAKRAFNSNSL